MLIYQHEFQIVFVFRVSKDLQGSLEKLDPQDLLDLLDKRWVFLYCEGTWVGYKIVSHLKISNHVLVQIEGGEKEYKWKFILWGVLHDGFRLLGLSWHWWFQRRQGVFPRQHFHPSTCLNVNKFLWWAHIISVARGKLVSVFLVPEGREEIQDPE